MTKKTVDHIWKALEEVLDPELYISIVDLGLVYTIVEQKGTIKITMTLTTLGCPLFPSIEADIRSHVESLPGVKSVEIELTFDPPWDTERMTEKGKAVLGI